MMEVEFNVGKYKMTELFKTSESLLIDLLDNSFVVSNIPPALIPILSEKLCSLRIFQTRVGALVKSSVAVAWYDLTNLLHELSKVGITEGNCVSDAALKRFNTLQEYNSNLEMFRACKGIIEKAPFHGKLFKAQESGAMFLLYRRVSGLFDEMGVGKTPESIYAYLLLCKALGRQCRCLVISPKSVKLEWQRAFKKFAKINAEPAENFKKSPIMLCHYEQLIEREITKKESGDNPEEKVIVPSKYLQQVLEFDYDVVIIDEAHFVKNFKSKRSKAFQRIIDRPVQSIKTFPIGQLDNTLMSRGQLPYIWFLTGTPMERPQDMYFMLNTAFSPIFPRFKDFINYYTIPETIYVYGRRVPKIGAAKNCEALSRLVGNMSIRRLRSSIVEIPFLDREIVLEMPVEYRREYDALVKGKVTDPLEQDKELDPLTRIIRGIQFLNNPKLVKSHLTSLKYPVVLDLVKSASGQVVIWTVFREAAKALGQYLTENGVSCTLYMGNSSEEEINSSEEAFSAGQVKVCVCTIAKGAVGVNFLKSADTVIYLEKPFSYTEWVQSRDRVMRVNRVINGPVLFVTISIHKAKTEELLERVIDEKRTLNEIVLDGKAEMEEKSS